MRHLGSFSVLLFVSVITVLPAWAQKGHLFGNCTGNIVNRYVDVDLKAITASEYAYGTSTAPSATKLLINGRSPNLWIEGLVAEDVRQFLARLSGQGYYTVSIANYSTRGWTIEGKKNKIQEQKAAQPRRTGEAVRVKSYAELAAERREQQETRRTQQAATKGDDLPKESARGSVELTNHRRTMSEPAQAYIANRNSVYSVLVTIRTYCSSNTQMRESEESTDSYRLRPGEEQHLGTQNETTSDWGCSYTIEEAVFTH